ncbi:Cof-type HAD-IIB family hydrolase, partial [Streptococcus pyogenes]
TWCHQVDIEFGFAGGQKPAVSKRDDLVDNAIGPVYGQVDVDPDFYKHSSVYHMWTFEDQGDVLQLSDDLLKDVRLVRWHENSSDVIKNGI